MLQTFRSACWVYSIALKSNKTYAALELKPVTKAAAGTREAFIDDGSSSIVERVTTSRRFARNARS
jgi:hypothetical protein